MENESAQWEGGHRAVSAMGLTAIFASSRHSLDPATSPPWPLAVGVLLVPEGVSTAAGAEHRLALALGAYRIGYYLLDLVEVRTAAGSSSHRSDTAAWAGVERLAAGVGVDALVVRCHPAAVFPRVLPDVLAHLPLRLVRG